MKRIVVKIGTRVLTGKKGLLDEEMIKNIVGQVSKLLDSHIDALIVSSGAIGSGMGLLGINKRPSEVAELQSMASIGQTRLMDVYNKFFGKCGYLTGQVLLTQDDFNDRVRYLNIRYTIDALLKHKAVPIINENDTISTEEIKCGDNDRLSALVSDLAEADALIILTDVDGLLDKKGSVVREVKQVTDEIRGFVKGSESTLSKGGMETKLNAAEFVSKSGIDCYIANGRSEDILASVVNGKGLFTHFLASSSKTNAKKRWIGFGSRAKGAVIVDDGAKEAILNKNKSLLPAGIISTTGIFKAGDTVGICDKKNNEFARGIVNYSSGEVMKIKGVKSSDIESVLGHKDHDEVIHKDNLAIL